MKMGSQELSEWINRLIEENKLYKFYLSKHWKKLKEEVLNEQHHECQECLKKGILTHTNTVHHINFVKTRPDLALSKTYIDLKGQTKPQLIAVCEECHNKLHKRFTKKEPLTEEWW